MNDNIISLKGNKSKSIEELTKMITDTITSKSYSAELVSLTKHNSNDQQVSLLVFEKFYLRNSGYVTLTILLTETNNEQLADIIGSGGGGGFLNIDYGVNSDIVQSAVKILKENGFTE